MLTAVVVILFLQVAGLTLLWFLIYKRRAKAREQSEALGEAIAKLKGTLNKLDGGKIKIADEKGLPEILQSHSRGKANYRKEGKVPPLVYYVDGPQAATLAPSVELLDKAWNEIRDSVAKGDMTKYVVHQVRTCANSEREAMIERGVQAARAFANSAGDDLDIMKKMTPAEQEAHGTKRFNDMVVAILSAALSCAPDPAFRAWYAGKIAAGEQHIKKDGIGDSPMNDIIEKLIRENGPDGGNLDGVNDKVQELLGRFAQPK